jgi:hypothetical protein
VRDTIVKHAGKSKIVMVEAVTMGETLSYYEAHIKTGKKTAEYKVDLEGKPVPEEQKK